MSRIDRARVISYYRSIVTTALFCIVSHILPDIGRKSRNLYISHVFNAPVGSDPIGILQRCLVLAKLD